MVAQASLDVALDGTVVAADGIRARCSSPGFDREPPAIWLALPARGGTESDVLADVIDRVLAQGWSVQARDDGVGFDGEAQVGSIYGLADPESGHVDVTVWLGEDWTC